MSKKRINFAIVVVMLAWSIADAGHSNDASSRNRFNIRRRFYNLTAERPEGQRNLISKGDPHV